MLTHVAISSLPQQWIMVSLASAAFIFAIILISTTHAPQTRSLPQNLLQNSKFWKYDITLLICLGDSSLDCSVGWLCGERTKLRIMLLIILPGHSRASSGNIKQKPNERLLSEISHWFHIIRHDKQFSQYFLSAVILPK